MYAFTAREVKNAFAEENRSSLSISFFFAAQTWVTAKPALRHRINVEIAQWTLHPVEHFHLLRSKFLQNLYLYMCQACMCVWLATTTTMSDASMILTLEHHNNRVVRMMSSLFVQVSSSQLQIAASVSVLWKLRYYSLSQNRCFNALVLRSHSNQIFYFICCRRKCVLCMYIQNSQDFSEDLWLNECVSNMY